MSDEPLREQIYEVLAGHHTAAYDLRNDILAVLSGRPQTECAHERKFCGWCLHTDIACRDCGKYLTENVGRLDGTLIQSDELTIVSGPLSEPESGKTYALEQCEYQRDKYLQRADHYRSIIEEIKELAKAAPIRVTDLRRILYRVDVSGEGNCP
jgi:hypothetical protein